MVAMWYTEPSEHVYNKTCFKAFPEKEQPEIRPAHNSKQTNKQTNKQTKMHKISAEM